MTEEYRTAIRGQYPNESLKNAIYIRNTVKARNVHIGEFTYYDTMGAETADFERDNILYNYPGHGELHIGKFTSIANGVEFIMGAANHSTQSFSSYPFSQISQNWASHLGMTKADMPDKGDTVIGNDVWIGRDARIMPGVMIGDGAVIGSNSVVAKDIPPYTIAVGNPATVIKTRFDAETIFFLEKVRWWDFDSNYLEMAIPYLSSLEHEHAKTELKRIASMNTPKKNQFPA